ncbi:hypothetical protein CN165_33480 [Sinorhizobium medicae]|uniref:hypothetical protein n=1 Tax=Sinorhizobium medicae TaxID=110321 RepID=UPI000FD796A7|nr:hypothetical protein [Sinorhizobium medicae]RVK06972.1 hypothetical protein CN165_33480 [Sinorhizobium medicae]
MIVFFEVAMHGPLMSALRRVRWSTRPSSRIWIIPGACIVQRDGKTYEHAARRPYRRGPVVEPTLNATFAARRDTTTLRRAAESRANIGANIGPSLTRKCRSMLERQQIH